MTSSEELSNKPIDYITSGLKSVLGATPFAGSLLTELVGAVIPNQRLDRIIKLILVLESKLANLEQEFVHSQLTNEFFSDLLEEAARQATHSLSDERREYIANIIVNSLSLQEIEYIESRHLLRILGELNDIEVIWLAYYSKLTMNDDEEFLDKHEAILTPIMATIGDPPSVVEKEALQESYKEHLSQLGLFQPQYKIDPRTNLPAIDRFSGTLKIRNYQLTSLGRLLLKQIGFSDPE